MHDCELLQGKSFHKFTQRTHAHSKSTPYRSICWSILYVYRLEIEYPRYLRYTTDDIISVANFFANFFAELTFFQAGLG